MERVRKQIGAEGLKLSGKGVCIAVLDTGVASHPDLKYRVKYFKDFVGRREGMYDDNSHGTHICGILCGDGKLSGGKCRGIAPDVQLVVCKVLDTKGEGSADAMLEALEFIRKYRKQLDIRIVNISIGIGDLKNIKTVDKLQRTVEALWDDGAVVVCAAGNKGPADGSISAVCNSTKVITVGCHDGAYFKDDKERCEVHSGRGTRFSAVRKPDIVAPGTQIMSCYSGWNKAFGKKMQYYIEKSGTSMATPIVSGCAALLLEKEPWLSPDQVKAKMLFSATDLREDWNKQGWGMINAKSLLESY